MAKLSRRKKLAFLFALRSWPLILFAVSTPRLFSTVQTKRERRGDKREALIDAILPVEFANSVLARFVAIRARKSQTGNGIKDERPSLDVHGDTLSLPFSPSFSLSLSFPFYYIPRDQTLISESVAFRYNGHLSIPTSVV